MSDDDTRDPSSGEGRQRSRRRRGRRRRGGRPSDGAGHQSAERSARTAAGDDAAAPTSQDERSGGRSEKQGGDGPPRRRRGRRRRSRRSRAEGTDQQRAAGARATDGDGRRDAEQPGDRRAGQGHARSSDEPAGRRQRRRRRRRRAGRRGPDGEPQQAEQSAHTSEGGADHVGAAKGTPPDDLDSGLLFPDEEAWDLQADADEEPPAERVRTDGSPFAYASQHRDPDGEDVHVELDEDPKLLHGSVCRVVGVRFNAEAQVDCDGGDLALEKGDRVVVETDRGLAVGAVVAPPQRRMVSTASLPRLLRRIDSDDSRSRRNAAREHEAADYCREQIRERRLPMKLVRVEYLHSGNRALFYFSADNRVDFRDLVKDLARRLRSRIEMRQVGVRDAARMTGGIGPCGRELCCSSWIKSFHPVSIKMAKEQNLVLNPSKVSGMCGRLKCCLAYEQSLYREARRSLPRVGQRVETPVGSGTVKELDIPRRLVRVLGSDGTMETFSAERVKKTGSPPRAPTNKRS